MQRKVAQVGSGELEYVDTGGSGPVIVLLHGALMDDRLWWPVVERLAPVARCVVPVLPLGAHARPMPESVDLTPAGVARLVTDLLEVLDLRRPVLVGNDTGGALAQLVAAHRPETLGGLVLVSCDAFDNFPPGLPGRTMALASAVPWGLRVAMASLRLPTLRRLPMTFGWMTRRPIDKATFTAWLDAYSSSAGVRRDLGRFLACVDRKVTLDAADRLRGFERPALVVWARDDRVMPVAHADRLVELLSDARLVLVPDSYTLVPLDQPQVLADLLVEFVTSPGANYSGQVPDVL